MKSESLVYLCAHPLAYPLIRGLSRLGSAVRIPGIGVVVNDAALARAVLTDTDTFRKDRPGSSGALWTPVLGPSVLLNMEGPAHQALRRRLSGLFTPSYVDTVCKRVLAAPLERLRTALAAGSRVDLVDHMHVITGSVMCELIGISTDEAACRAMFTRGEQIVSMVKLRTRALSPSQMTRARAVLSEITAPAAAAYRQGDETTVLGRMRALGLSEAEALGAAAAFFLTGTETVSTFVPRLIALLHDNGVLDRVAADPTLLDHAIDEGLRVTTPTPAMLRSVAKISRLGRLTVRPGERIVIATHNCARAYGAEFSLEHDHPAELRHLWFGSGPHFCIGQPLAMAEIRAVTRAVLHCAPIRIVRRKYARRVLIPTYRILEIAR